MLPVLDSLDNYKILSERMNVLTIYLHRRNWSSVLTSAQPESAVYKFIINKYLFYSTGMINVVHLYAYMYGRWYMSSTICMLYIICMCTCTYGYPCSIYTFINNMCVLYMYYVLYVWDEQKLFKSINTKYQVLRKIGKNSELEKFSSL